MSNSYCKIKFVFHHVRNSWLPTNTLIRNGNVCLIIYEGMNILNYLEESSRLLVGQSLREMWVLSGEERSRWLVQGRRDNPKKFFIFIIVYLYRTTMCLHCKPSILKYCAPIIRNTFWQKKGIVIILSMSSSFIEFLLGDSPKIHYAI